MSFQLINFSCIPIRYKLLTLLLLSYKGKILGWLCEIYF